MYDIVRIRYATRSRANACSSDGAISMQEPHSPEHHRQRSEFIRKLVQRPSGQHSISDRSGQPTPKTIVQYWHDLGQLPPDVEECVRSWTIWETSGFKHRLFDERTAG